ncbi:MAG: ATPase, T2SS/T4P/T4SS family [bacterium]
MPDIPAKVQPRVITFSGPKDGTGKSSIALNLALAWANYQKRNVLIIPMDPLCRQDHSSMLGLNSPAMADIVRNADRESAGALGALLKGKIPLSQWGVGVLPLAHRRADVQKLSPDVMLTVFSKLSQSFDIFIDVDPYFPMQVFSFDISDIIFWVTNSQRSHLEATNILFREISDMHFAMDRFEMVVNLYDLPGAINPKEVDSFFQQKMQKKVLAYMPWEDALPALANQQKILVVEQPQAAWLKSLRILMGRVAENKPLEKQWASSVSAEEFGHGSDMLWKTSERMDLPSARSGPEARADEKAEVPSFWDELKNKIHGNVVSALELERIRISDDAGTSNPETRKKVEEIAGGLLQKEQNLQLTRDQRNKFINELLDEILGYGPLEELMRDPAVTEIMVNDPDRVYIERAGKLTLTRYRFRDEDQIIQVIKRIVAPLGRRIDESVPLVDARLKDGSRVNAVIPPLAVSGPTLTIRRFSQKPFGAEDLIKKNSVSRECLAFLKGCVKLRKDIIISGGTGTGKTTFLNLLSGFIPEDERIVTVEDTAELRLQQEHWVRLESRPANIEGKGEVTIRDLVKNCLRMRPDRIVVGEVRGSEALDMLQAMNTGHEGSLATIHANTPRDALTRLEAMCLMAGAALPIWALREMIVSAVHVIVQLTRFSDGTRKITGVTEVTGREETQILTHNIFKYTQTGVEPDGSVIGEFSATGEPPKFFAEFQARGVPMPIEIFWTEEQKKERMGKGK